MMRSIANQRCRVTIGIVVGLVFNLVLLELSTLFHPPPVEFDPMDAIQMA
jgi:hypothetical protein